MILAYSFNSLSITIISFAFHPIIPTISKYLKYNINDIVLAILIGSSIPIFIYIVWEIILLGIIPTTGNLSISIAYKNYEHKHNKMAYVIIKPRRADSQAVPINLKFSNVEKLPPPPLTLGTGGQKNGKHSYNLN